MLRTLALACVLSQVYCKYEDIEWDSDPYWFDEFSGTSLDATKWKKGRTESNSKHYQHYEDKNVKVENDHLIIETYYEMGTQTKGKVVPYASGAITTEGGRQDFLPPVKFEIMARLPMYNLLLPTLHTAIWLQKTCTDPNGILAKCYQEYDIMEAYDDFRDNRITAAYHFNNRAANDSTVDPDHPCYWNTSVYIPSQKNLFSNYDNSGPNIHGKNNDGYYPWKSDGNYSGHYFSDDGNFHKWTFEWLSDRLTLYVDNEKVSNVTDLNGTIAYQPMGLIINTAICTPESWCGKHEPNWGPEYYNNDSSIVARFLVDSVRVYKPAWEFEPYWFDEFNDASLDTDQWDYVTAVGSAEAHHYETDSVKINSGLTIESFYSPVTGSNFQSGGLTTAGKIEFKYPVKIEISMKLPDYNLIYPTVHPRIYLIRSDDVPPHPSCFQEYHIMGQYNGFKNNKVYAQYKFNKLGSTYQPYQTCRDNASVYLPTTNDYLFKAYRNNQNAYPYYPMSTDPLNRNPPGWPNNGNAFSDDYHKWTFEWLENSITLKIDDRIVSQVTNNDNVYMPFQPMHLYITMPIIAESSGYSNADSTDWAQNDTSVIKKFDIKYVKVYTKPGVIPPSPSPAGKTVTDNIYHIEPLGYLGKDVNNNGYYYGNNGISNGVFIFILAFIFIFILCVMIASSIYIYKNNTGRLKYATVTFDEILKLKG